ncbi:protein of unknown function [Legionella micdadei]|uniref:Uncharacterized protein n=1 Tax=Legionella micdadei TaxID=451 RepID=A0A098GG90_LEGMI|nr:hypothetical protein Lmic_2910 [Legionella micdadei]CEG61483.1 protein of unknown function [Legionella micdadei]SCY44010.1 hypothetical protein SAMN02982997_01692 [Legionella micdadei]
MDFKIERNQLLGFHEATPRINYGLCVYLLNCSLMLGTVFKDKVRIVFLMTKSREECWNIRVYYK